MGFVKSNVEVESYLEEHNLIWYQLKDSEYRELMKQWRQAFEGLLEESEYEVYGDSAIEKLKMTLDGGTYIFNTPNYQYLLVTPSAHTATFAYYVEQLNVFDRELFNRNEAIVCNNGMDFMCAFNHEASVLAPELFCQAEKTVAPEITIV
ncbi:MAG: hypothetical protein ACI8WB_005137 [Phenylobacterium sp.]|jgi:hypothetical protein